MTDVDVIFALLAFIPRSASREIIFASSRAEFPAIASEALTVRVSVALAKRLVRFTKPPVISTSFA